MLGFSLILIRVIVCIARVQPAVAAPVESVPVRQARGSRNWDAPGKGCEGGLEAEAARMRPADQDLRCGDRTDSEQLQKLRHLLAENLKVSGRRIVGLVLRCDAASRQEGDPEVGISQHLPPWQSLVRYRAPSPRPRRHAHPSRAPSSDGAAPCVSPHTNTEAGRGRGRHPHRKTPLGRTGAVGGVAPQVMTLYVRGRREAAGRQGWR
jgi:hypothetical protein